MTPEDKAVIKAAMAWRKGSEARNDVDETLASAVETLIYSCPQCNTGGHTCPGCGESIAHTDTACAVCSDTLRDPAMKVDALPDLPLMGPENDLALAHEMERPAEWVPATMREAIKGDTVRLGTSEAKVAGIGPDWKGHVDPRSGKYEALPLEHALIPVRLEGRDDLLHLAPTLEIEILMTIERRAALVVQRAFPGSSVTS